MRARGRGHRGGGRRGADLRELLVRAFRCVPGYGQGRAGADAQSDPPA